MRRPILLAIGGRVASGKSTLARSLADALGAALLVADRVAEEARSEGAARLGSLAAGFEDEVYRELLRRAEGELAAGRSAVLDAAFPTRALRRAARALAERRGARFGLVECRADEAALRSRLEARARAAGLAPGAWLALARELDRRFEAVDELPEGEHAVVDARRGARAAAEEALAWLGASPAAD